MGIFSNSKEILAGEKKKQIAAKASKPKRSTGESIKIWFFRVFYTLFMLLIVYTIVLSCTLSIPQIMAVVVESLGYNLNSMAEVVLASLSGLFFVAWIFALSFFVVKKAFSVYVGKMKALVAEPETEVSVQDNRSNNRKHK